MTKVECIVKAMDDKLAQDIVAINMENASPLYDTFILCTASNKRLLNAIQDNVVDQCEMNGFEIKTLEKGVLIDGKKTAPCKVKIRKKEKDSSIIELTIHEGKNHQVKKMFETIGFKVLKLKREKLAFLNLSGLKPGEYRYLSIKEVKMLYSLK